MSPTKPSTSASTRLQRPVGAMVSSIPRRIKTNAAASSKSQNVESKKSQNVESKSKTVLRSKLKSKSSTGNKGSVLNDSTATALSTKVTSYFASAQYGGDNKENIPLSGVMTRSRTNRVNGGSPTRGKSGISKATPSILQRSALARLPLRELSEGEIFERDEATLGDLRRRRSGEHSGAYVEFDSHTTQPVDTRASSTTTSSTVKTRSQTTAAAATAIAEEEEEKCGGKIRVLRRTDSEEALQVKIKAIMAATAAASSSSIRTTKKFSTLRKKIQTPTKLKHPALKDSPVFSPSTTPLPFAGPSERFLQPPTKQSPVLSRQTTAAVTKRQQSPVRPARMGLGVKNANTIMKEVTNAIKANPDKGKRIIICASNNTTIGQKKMVAKKPAGGLNTLRRAAGPSRPATTTAKTGLESIRRMR